VPAIYERLINLTDDPGVKEALGFLMTREIAHQKSFEKALYSITPNFPSGKLPGMPQFASTYFNLSRGPGEERGPWNQGEKWNFVSDPDESMAVDGGNGEASVELPSADAAVVEVLAARTASDPTSDPLTGAELGMQGEPEVGDVDEKPAKKKR
jgi:Mn-containing catalase